MSKSKIQPEQANDALNELMITGESQSGVTFEQAFEIMEAAPDAGLTELTSEYFNFEKEGTFHFSVEGMGTANIDGKEIEIVKLKDKTGRNLINGNAVLVNSCKRLTQLPCYIRVVYNGEVKTAKGSYKNLQVLTFPSATK